MDKPPHLTLVTPTHTQSEHDQEFIPLPFYPWTERPSTLPLDPDECATAIHVAKGDIPKAAAALLKVSQSSSSIGWSAIILVLFACATSP